MVRRRHDRELRLRLGGERALDGEALLVDGDGHRAHAGERQRLARADEARLLDPGRLVRIEHQPGKQRQALAHARRDHDGLGRRRQSRGRRRDSRRWRRAARHGRRDAARSRPPRTARRHSRSSSRAHSAKGKASRSGWPVGKASGASSNSEGRHGIAQRRPGAARQDGGGGAVVGWRAGGLAARRGQHLVGQVGRDGEAGRRLRHDVALGDQLVHGQQHGAARAPRARSPSGARKAGAGRAPAAVRGWRAAPARRSGGAAACSTRHRGRDPSGADLRTGRGITGTVLLSKLALSSVPYCDSWSGAAIAPEFPS